MPASSAVTPPFRPPEGTVPVIVNGKTSKMRVCVRCYMTIPLGCLECPRHKSESIAMVPALAST
jgi:hypothetical protein